MINIQWSMYIFSSDPQLFEKRNTAWYTAGKEGKLVSDTGVFQEETLNLTQRAENIGVLVSKSSEVGDKVCIHLQ